MRSSSALALLVVPGLVGVGGCVIDRGPIAGDQDAARLDAPFPDVGQPDAFGVDAFRDIDVFFVPDAGVDAATPGDTGPMDDVRSPDDAWMPDAFVEPDAFTPPDAFVIPDAFTPPDAFVVPDAFTPLDAFTAECTEGATRCTMGSVGMNVEQCTGGRWAIRAACSALGCGTSARDPQPHCLQLVPSNVAASEMRGGPDVVINTSGTIDTTACSGGGGIAASAFRVVGDYCVVSVGGLRVEASAQVEIVGTRPFIVLATGDVAIAGDLAAVGRGATSGGAGESPTGAGGDGTADGSDDGGGGGGSHCGSGGRGGDGGTGGSPGATASATLLSPLRGGSPGGRGSGEDALRGAGGRGGGAIQISSSGTITVSGIVYATGGGGRGGTRRTSLGGGSAASGGGGGSGGAVLLEATSVVFTGGSRVDLRGGGGGSAACYDNISVPDEDGAPGQDGYSGAGTRPAGGAAPMCEGPSIFSGGAGGAGSGDGNAGALDGANADNGGGGGGGAGCVAVRSVVLPTIPTYPTSSSVVATGAPQAD